MTMLRVDSAKAPPAKQIFHVRVESISATDLDGRGPLFSFECLRVGAL